MYNYPNNLNSYSNQGVYNSYRSFPVQQSTYNTNSGNYSNSFNDYSGMVNDDERFFFAPFLIGGLAGGALGYGIGSNNNQNNTTTYYPVYPAYPTYPTYPVFPTYSNSNYYYY